jgi:UDP-N-acetylglucosamine--N-acetylmuramyl-(pentapeptide) pyrophosphoryl-undecaprenol N-acetylglucosamine transferase
MDKGIVLLAAGGPAAISFPQRRSAHELKAGGWSVHLVTDSRAERLCGKLSGGEIHVVPSGDDRLEEPHQPSPSSPLRCARATSDGARKLMARLKPKVVVGFGGYPTVPPLLAATGMGIPSMIHEQNAVMGRANKASANRVKAIAGGFLPEPAVDMRFQDGDDGQSGPPAVLERRDHSLSALDGWRIPPRGLRRQPGRAVLLQGHPARRSRR